MFIYAIDKSTVGLNLGKMRESWNFAGVHAVEAHKIKGRICSQDQLKSSIWEK